MNNKKGGFGAKLLLVLILMIASAVGGAYGYRILDGKMASRDALKAVEKLLHLLALGRLVGRTGGGDNGEGIFLNEFLDLLFGHIEHRTNKRYLSV